MSETSARHRSALARAVAAQIRAERAASGMTQEQVITASGLPRSTYLRLEAGKRVVDVSQLAAVARALGISPSVMLARAEDRAEVEPTPQQNADAARAGMSPEARARLDEAFPPEGRPDEHGSHEAG